MRVRLTFPPSLIQEPIIYRLVKDFDIVINIRRADVPSAKPDARYRRALSRLESGDVDTALAETMRESTIKSNIEKLQITMRLEGPDALRTFLADQMKLWGPVVREHNIKGDA